MQKSRFPIKFLWRHMELFGNLIIISTFRSKFSTLLRLIALLLGCYTNERERTWRGISEPRSKHAIPPLTAMKDRATFNSTLLIIP